LTDLEKANDLKTDNDATRIGLAITYHALSRVEEAIHLWKQLIDRNPKYSDADWVKEEHDLAEPLVEEASKLIAKL
jgi:hypothetical protein